MVVYPLKTNLLQNAKPCPQPKRQVLFFHFYHHQTIGCPWNGKKWKPLSFLPSLCIFSLSPLGFLDVWLFWPGFWESTAEIDLDGAFLQDHALATQRGNDRQQSDPNGSFPMRGEHQRNQRWTVEIHPHFLQAHVERFPPPLSTPFTPPFL